MTVSAETMDQVAALTREILEERFGDDFVFDPILVMSRIDQYGDEYVEIKVVYDGDMKNLDPGWTVGLSTADVGCVGRTRRAGFASRLRFCREIRLGSRTAQIGAMNPSHLLCIARQLAAGSGRCGRPRQTDLCRAVSATYYAQFHTDGALLRRHDIRRNKS